MAAFVTVNVDGANVRVVADAALQQEVTYYLSGTSGNGSFFMDFAIRKTTYTAETYLPYYDYTNYDKNGQQVNTPSPQISYIRRPVNAILTFGWRF